jgi:hypothetical protein
MPAGADGGFDAESLLRSLMDNIPGAIYRAANDAEAARAKVTLRRVAGGVEAEVADDGRDGADAARGSGLRGLGTG